MTPNIQTSGLADRITSGIRDVFLAALQVDDPIVR
jgi:hypothetical protein